MKQSLPAGNFFFVAPCPEQEANDLRDALRNPASRRVLRRVLSVSRVLGASMGTDTRLTEYGEGLRAVGLWLATNIETAAPGELARLMLDSGNDLQAEMAKRNRRNADDNTDWE